MQRFIRHQVDQFGNPASGATCTVYNSGTYLAVLANIYSGADDTDTPTTPIANPLIIGADGDIHFAVADGDYDIIISGSNLPATTYIYRWNAFDGSTASAAPFSQVALTMPADFVVTGSPAGASGTIGVAWGKVIKNKFFASPATGASAAPSFRYLDAADGNTVFCDLTTLQTVAGAKTFSSAAVFSSTVSVAGALTASSTSSLVGAVTLGNTISIPADKDILVAGSQGWASCPINTDISLGVATGTICTTAALGAGGYNIPAFADGVYVFGISGVIRLPNDYAAGTDIYPFLNWTTTGTNANNVKWGIEYTVVTGNNTGAFPAPATLSVLTAASGTTNKLMYSEFSAITGTTFLPNTCLVCRIFRDAPHGTDNNAETALLISAGISYKSSRFSTKNRVPSFYV